MTEFPVVLVINCGSSSIKFSVLGCRKLRLPAQRRGRGHQRGTGVSLCSTAASRWRWQQRGYEGALQAIAGALAQRDLIDSVALIGHRVAHGGDLFTESVIISEEVINNIRQVSSLAPLHNYASLSGIASAQRLFPEVMQVAVFDTSFHQTLAPEAFSLWSAVGVLPESRGTPLRFPRHLAPLCVPARPGAARVAGAGERPGDRPPGAMAPRSARCVTAAAWTPRWG